MIDYLKTYGHIPFRESPMNDVDLLIFAQLAYMDFEAVSQTPCPFSHALARASFADSGDASEDRFSFQKKDDRLLSSLSASCPRYQEIEFLRFERHFDPEAETQFAALALALSEDHLLIAFRGTDNTLAGWKEDFNMAFMDEIPAQRMALEFLEETAENAGKITVIGHSKGGNLALYAASACSYSLHKRIAQTVSFDGPGLNEHVIHSEGFIRMEDRMRVVRPRASLVGMLFEQPKNIRTIDSRVFSLLQHYPYFWKTDGMDFIDLARPSFDSTLLGKTLCGLLERLPVEAREQLIESVYKIISASDAATFNDLADTWLKSAAAIAMELFRTDSQTRKLFLRTLSAFLSSAAQALSDSFAPEEKK